MTTVILYGNLITDTVYFQDGRHEFSFGGVGNVARELDRSLLVGFNTHESSANVHVDTTTGNVTSEVTWGNIDRFVPLVMSGAWHHVAYLNTVPGLTTDFFTSLEGTISADLCSIRQHGIGPAVELAAGVDYLFMSEEESYFFFPAWRHNMARIATIIHNEEGSMVYTNDFKEKIAIQPIKPPFNPLGAGDTLVANFINANLVKRMDFIEALVESHHKTKDFIKNKNVS